MTDRHDRSNAVPRVSQRVLKVKLELVFLLGLTVLIGLINWLTVNQKAVLYLFYVPVVLGSWVFPRRQAIGVAVLAALLVVSYVVFLPRRFRSSDAQVMMLWSELAVWGGILVITAWIIATLRSRAVEALRNLRRAYEGVLAILSKFVETKDADTGAHSVRVSTLAATIARELGLSPEQIEEIRIAGMLHDVGKTEVSIHVLRSAGTLSLEEQAMMRQHTSQGAAMVRPLGDTLVGIADAVELHHEHYDGTGYKGLRGENIPLSARIIAAADALDSLLSDRPYRRGVTIQEAMASIDASIGTHFDPMVVAAIHKFVTREGEGALLGVGSVSAA